MTNNLIGTRVGSLIIESFSHKDNRRKAYFNCLCDCGNNTIVRIDHLKEKSILSCGKHRLYLFDYGVYRIRNLITGDFYIGSSENLVKRKNNHFSDLRNNRHSNRNLQEDYNIYGHDNFKFEVLFYCDIKHLELFEQRSIKFLNPKYNLIHNSVPVWTSKSRENFSEVKKNWWRLQNVA